MFYNGPLNTSVILLACLSDSLVFQVEGKDLLNKKYPLGTHCWHEKCLKRAEETYNELVHTLVFNNGMQNISSSTIDIAC